MIKSNLALFIEFIDQSLGFHGRGPCVGKHNCNPSVNLKLLGFFGVTESWPVHDRWFNNDHEWDSAQWEQCSANEVPTGLFSQLPFFTYTLIMYVYYIKLFLWKQFSLFPTLNGQLDFYPPILTVKIVVIMYIINCNLGLGPCDLYTLLNHYLQVRKQNLSNLPKVLWGRWEKHLGPGMFDSDNGYYQGYAFI